MLGGRQSMTAAVMLLTFAVRCGPAHYAISQRSLKRLGNNLHLLYSMTGNL